MSAQFAHSPTQPPTLLVVAKAPVSGLAKSRLGATIGHELAARIAAAALLDTLQTAQELGWPVVVAMTGELNEAERGEELAVELAKHTVVDQRGEDFATRLVAAHHDAARHGGVRSVDSRRDPRRDSGRDDGLTQDAAGGVVQIGMDTPQVTVEQLRAAGAALADHDAALGPAEDGGWWVLAVREPHWSTCLKQVPMSTPDTGAHTHAALTAAGADVGQVAVVADVDTWADAKAVAALIPESRFAAEVTRVSSRDHFRDPTQEGLRNRPGDGAANSGDLHAVDHMRTGS
ncbi:MAG TPA: DUF2064 domain-containing protein [Candidatus Nesterenkonia stercoripullorum]|uniref:DUF2064 domain-containing protein n=1 Tax=Candidatus Nesterenkonia stercoripullorum TaxID=2838701 RepID=A0A9D1S1H5_9MICC|nr:DUF2064 domain-containing protein [Candidatus Nesterenkonia stercoripullorum]